MNLNAPSIRPGLLTAEDIAELGDHASTEQFAELRARDRKRHIDELLNGLNDETQRDAVRMVIARKTTGGISGAVAEGLAAGFRLGRKVAEDEKQRSSTSNMAAAESPSHYDATEQRDAVRALLSEPWVHHTRPLLEPEREDQSQPAPGIILALILGLCLGVPALMFWIGRWTA